MTSTTTGEGRAPSGVGRRRVLKASALAALSIPAATRFAAPAAAADPAIVGSWSAPFAMGGIAIHATLTHVGDVLFFQYVEGAAGVDHTSYVGTWNWATGARAAAPFPYERDFFCAGQNVLPDGRIFVAGGHDHTTGKKADPVGVAETDTFTPSTRTWTQGPLMSQKRWYPTTVGLPDGRVLIFGGHDRPGLPSNTVELYDAATNTITELPSTATKALGLYPKMHLMANGKVLRTGPARMTASFDPTTYTWTNVGNTLASRRLRAASILLPGATTVLTVGGQPSESSPPTGTAEVLDSSAATPVWRATGSLNIPRILANTVNLPDGTVLLVGGGRAFQWTDPVRTPELYDPATGTWRLLAPQLASRMYHATALLLPDGRVLSAGQDNGSWKSHGEIFSPPYLFKGSRPTITGAPSTTAHGQQLTITTPSAASISKVTLIRPGSVTHQIDTDQRAVPLSFAAGSGSIVAQVPANRSLLPPGFYMLFLVNRTGVPSVASWIKVQ